MMFPIFAFGKDMIVLKNGHAFEGDVKKISKFYVILKIEETAYRIPAKDLYFVGLDELERTENDESYINLKAYQDAELRGRFWHNFIGGILLGPVTVGYDLIKTYHPLKDERVILLSPNKGYFSNPAYLYSYNIAAKRNATLQAAAGWLLRSLIFKN